MAARAKKSGASGLEAVVNGRAQTRGEAARERLVEAAWRTIAEEGLQALTTRRVATRAGLSHGMCHYHFETKDDLILAVVEHIRRYWIEPLEGHLASDGPIFDRLSRIVDWMAEPATQDVVRVHLSLLAQAQADARLREKMRSEYRRWQDGYVALFRGLQAAGLLRADLDPVNAGSAFAAASDALVQERSLDPGLDTAALMWALLTPMLVSQAERPRGSAIAGV
jgi:AcrR family transcriptional regulator